MKPKNVIRRLLDAFVINFRKIHFRDFLPLLHLWIEIPFISVRTELMGQRLERMTREYIAVQVRIWKWHGTFELYDTMRRVHDRRY
jgi:hypothetical protein